jgi:hypothetical protein
VTIDELLAQLERIREKAEPQTRDALAGFAKQLKAYDAERDKQISEQTSQLAEKDTEIADLKNRLEGTERISRASPTDLAKSFRAVIEEFHAEAQQADEVGVAIRTLDLEVKGLVEVDEQATTLVLPGAGAAIDPTTLSTLRVSFAAVPVVPAETPTPPPEPPPTTRARRTRS